MGHGQRAKQKGTKEGPEFKQRPRKRGPPFPARQQRGGNAREPGEFRAPKAKAGEARVQHQREDASGDMQDPNAHLPQSPRAGQGPRRRQESGRNETPSYDG